ncbi:hypothetical protein Kpho01_64880 [Kitasatospora phosalacinea]|uniref:Uncharacterized protein n=1 Tax=Kitasatospora phosalacinea TaxID=2065 RepID=A0A9W6PPH8_9ACTN|nr:hypothetical protein Kpho01_64880 [Kitasatospora phosalacinea]
MVTLARLERIEFSKLGVERGGAGRGLVPDATIIGARGPGPHAAGRAVTRPGQGHRRDG